MADAPEGGERGLHGPAPAIHGGDLPLLRMPLRHDPEPEAPGTQGRAHQYPIEKQRRKRTLVPGLPRRKEPRQVAACIRSVDRLYGELQALRPVPRGQVPGLEGRHSREADGTVEREEGVSPVRPLPQPAQPAVQRDPADAAASPAGKYSIRIDFTTEPARRERHVG